MADLYTENTLQLFVPVYLSTLSVYLSLLRDTVFRRGVCEGKCLSATSEINVTRLLNSAVKLTTERSRESCILVVSGAGCCVMFHKEKLGISGDGITALLDLARLSVIATPRNVILFGVLQNTGQTARYCQDPLQFSFDWFVCTQCKGKSM
jgi:hypothetical protein